METVPIDREGTFRAEIQRFGVEEYDSGAVSISVWGVILEAWNPESQEWEDWRRSDYGIEANGKINVLTKDGKANDTQIKALVEHCGWDGNLSTITDGLMLPCLCQVSIKAETYKNRTTYRINWINAYDRVPVLDRSISTSRAKELQARYGSQFRALVGNVARNAQAPTGPAALRPASPPPSIGTPEFNREVNEAEKDEIPF